MREVSDFRLVGKKQLFGLSDLLSHPEHWSETSERWTAYLPECANRRSRQLSECKWGQVKCASVSDEKANVQSSKEQKQKV